MPVVMDSAVLPMGDEQESVGAARDPRAATAVDAHQRRSVSLVNQFGCPSDPVT